MAVGKKHQGQCSKGNALFFEIEPNLENDYFHLHDLHHY